MATVGSRRFRICPEPRPAHPAVHQRGVVLLVPRMTRHLADRVAEFVNAHSLRCAWTPNRPDVNRYTWGLATPFPDPHGGFLAGRRTALRPFLAMLDEVEGLLDASRDVRARGRICAAARTCGTPVRSRELDGGTVTTRLPSGGGHLDASTVGLE